ALLLQSPSFPTRRSSDLYEQGIIRIYDVLFPATVLLETDSYIRDFLVREKLDGPITTAELHYRIGQDLLKKFPGCEEHSVVARADRKSTRLNSSHQITSY